MDLNVTDIVWNIVACHFNVEFRPQCSGREYLQTVCFRVDQGLWLTCLIKSIMFLCIAKLMCDLPCSDGLALHWFSFYLQTKSDHWHLFALVTFFNWHIDTRPWWPRPWVSRLHLFSLSNSSVFLTNLTHRGQRANLVIQYVCIVESGSCYSCFVSCTRRDNRWLMSCVAFISTNPTLHFWWIRQ